ncbi:MBL fold metallo-hydrolase [Mesoterricola silvestris]|uniref:cAMP phosphodiesterase class-II:metallo-beta-lactamase superfamily protein n=1 Tax=Mesoterricola silvestris TaxID=2927979 RepID=A0AA48GEN4_9BACT|nr:3',5'-cyclic-nucleotide phosphodiesterase [Mesoterricola silvestris]BDU71141.1 cAMP phosphodiesterase class-II:metallo-beta-lactamase superfamily protein [Mesoterricola silvestris]
MELRVLGCSGGEAEGSRLTGLLVNGTVAIDAGSLTQALTLAEQVKVRQIFISHSHLDHICTLPFFTKNIFGHTQVPVEIHALPETLDALRRHLFNDELWPDFSVIPSPDNPIIRFSEIEPGRTYEVEGLRVTPIPVNHLVPCVGYRVEDDHSAFIFSSDTAATDRVYEEANATANLRLFITEASFPNAQAWLADAAKHLTPEKLGEELRKLKVDVPVGIYHLTPGDREVMLPELSALGDPRLTLLEQDARFEW